MDTSITFGDSLPQPNWPTNTARHLVLQELVHGPFHYPKGGDKSHQLVDPRGSTQVPISPPRSLVAWKSRVRAMDRTMDREGRAGTSTNTSTGGLQKPTARVRMKSMRHTCAFCRFARCRADGESGFANPTVCRRQNSWRISIPRDYSARRGKSAMMRDGLAYSLLWGRDTSQDNADAFLRKMDAEWLITGHIPSDDGFAVPNNRQIILDAKGTPAGYCLFPTDRPVTHQELVERITLLP